MNIKKAAQKWVNENTVALSTEAYDVIIMKDEVYGTQKPIKKQLKKLIEKTFNVTVDLTGNAILVSRDNRAEDWLTIHNTELLDKTQDYIVFRDVPEDDNVCRRIAKLISQRYVGLLAVNANGVIVVLRNSEKEGA